MNVVGVGKRVQIFVDEGDHFQHESLFLAILKRLRAEGAAGATVARGIAGFGAHSQIHSAHLVDIMSPLPLVITWIDAPERVDRLLPAICEMVTEGLVTVEDVSIVKYTHRDLPAIRPTLTVRELMTPEVVTVHPDTSLAETVNVLIGRDFRSVPVTSDDGRIRGIVTNGDLIERGGLPARIELLAVLGPEARAEAVSRAHAHSVREIMTPDPVTIRPDAPIEQGAEVMIERKLKRLPVTAEDGRLLGVISRVDILRALGEGYPAPDAEVPGPAEPAVVGDIMGHHAPVVREGARLTEVLDAVVSTRLNRAIVVDDEGRVKGMISDAQVLERLDPRSRSGVLGALMLRGRTVPEVAAKATAAEMMSAPATTVTADTPVAAAARLMVESRFKVLPVVDGEGRLLGIIDRAHLLAAARDEDREG